jgi:ABC-type multidrug transport system permease subunit
LIARRAGYDCAPLQVWLYPDLKPTRWTYWLLMQIAMIVGFLTTYPVNWWLIRRGTKEKM